MAVQRLAASGARGPRTQADIETDHLAAIASADYATNIDKQQRTLETVADARRRAGDGVLSTPFVQNLLGAASLRVGERIERLWALTLLTPVEIRRALKARRTAPPDRLPHERLYPTDGWLGAYLDLTILSEQPLAYHFWVGATVLGSCLRRNLYMDLGFEDVLYPNHYIFLVGGTGLGKNQAIGVGARVVERANSHPHLIDFCLAEDRDIRVRVLNETTYEGLIDQLLPGKGYFPAQDAWAQRIESCGFLINAEASTVIGKARKEISDRLIGGLTDWYDGKARETAGRAAGVKKLGPLNFSMILGSNEQWITDNIGQSVISGGFTGRCLMVHRSERDRIKYRDIPAAYAPDPTIEAALADMLVPWMTAEGPIEARWTSPAQVAWEKWYVLHREAACPNPRLEGWWQRKPAHVAKLAMLLMASQVCEKDLDLGGVRSIDVPQEYFEKALELLDEEQRRIPALLQQLDAHPDFSRIEWVFARIVELWNESKGEPVTHHEVAKAIRHKVPTAQAQAQLLQTLAQDGRITAVITGTKKAYKVLRRD